MVLLPRRYGLSLSSSKRIDLYLPRRQPVVAAASLTGSATAISLDDDARKGVFFSSALVFPTSPRPAAIAS